MPQEYHECKVEGHPVPTMFCTFRTWFWLPSKLAHSKSFKGWSSWRANFRRRCPVLYLLMFKLLQPSTSDHILSAYMSAFSAAVCVLAESCGLTVFWALCAIQHPGLWTWYPCHSEAAFVVMLANAKLKHTAWCLSQLWFGILALNLGLEFGCFFPLDYS